MINMKDYFDAHVMMAIEVEYADGGRDWNYMTRAEVKPYLGKVVDGKNTYLSDIDFSTKQNDAWVKKVLNTAYINWTKNFEWVRERGINSLYELVDWIIENNRVPFTA